MMIYPIEIDIRTGEFLRLEKSRCKDERKSDERRCWTNNGAILVESPISWKDAAKIAWEERTRWLRDNTLDPPQLPSSRDVAANGSSVVMETAANGSSLDVDVAEKGSG